MIITANCPVAPLEFRNSNLLGIVSNYFNWTVPMWARLTGISPSLSPPVVDLILSLPRARISLPAIFSSFYTRRPTRTHTHTNTHAAAVTSSEAERAHSLVRCAFTHSLTHTQQQRQQHISLS
jgi:hypothetical protein